LRRGIIKQGERRKERGSEKEGWEKGKREEARGGPYVTNSKM